MLTIQNVNQDLFGKIYNLFKHIPAANRRYIQEGLYEAAFEQALEEGGVERLYRDAGNFSKDGVFSGRAWDNGQDSHKNITNFQFQKSTASAGGEILYILYILAIARGQNVSDDLSSQKANSILTELLINNMNLFLKETEGIETSFSVKRKLESKLFQFVMCRCFSPSLVKAMQEKALKRLEFEEFASKGLLNLMENITALAGKAEFIPGWGKVANALLSPTELSACYPDDYMKMLEETGDLVLIREATQLKKSTDETKIVSSYHFLFLTYINKNKPYLLQSLLCSNSISNENLRSHLKLIRTYLHQTLKLRTRQDIYRLMMLLRRNNFKDHFLSHMERNAIKMHIYADSECK
ncbi:hypothetical protein [Bacillus massilinigeriensis]|uniref:hypothetical protein n=1 Tax=Bacillus mediterraneensis TaxID=1805474 RepID=UPI0008F8D508|nr:hypothetical protein [Bacillus mediterraneensis]